MAFLGIGRGAGGALLFASLAVAACSSKEAGAPPASSAAPPAAVSSAPPPDRDAAFEACEARYRAVLASAKAPGAPAFDAHRAAFLGRVRGEPVVFVRAPERSSDETSSLLLLQSKSIFDERPPGLRVDELKARLQRDKPSLRAMILREGYLYAEEPDDLFEMIERVSLTDLFDDATLYLQRKNETSRLERAGTPKEPRYVFAEGPFAGRSVQLLFGDRIAQREADLAAPLHRDIATLSDAEGFERVRIDRLTEGDVAVTLRFGDEESKAVLEAHGAALSLACLAEPRSRRERAAEHARATEPHRAAMRALGATVTQVVFEAHPFDRPRDVKGPDRDGELRPFWTSAYLRGQQSFEHDGATYTVYRADGLPNTPEVCVDFVLDSFERAAGSWYAPRGERPHRDPGRLSFDGLAVDRPRGVIALGKLAEAEPRLFEMRRFAGAERIPFGDRAKFFAFLEEHADLFAPGDVLSIQGLKRDDRVHQHAILLEAIDPITGIPFGLADQMRLPRRRSWEGIMAEAPKRSLYYRIRPKAAITEKLVVTQGDTSFAKNTA